MKTVLSGAAPTHQEAGGWRHPAALAALLALALILRLWFASDDPSPARVYDERFAIENIVAIVHSGSLEPANGYHPALSYLPATAVIAAVEGLHRTLGWPVESPLGGTGLTATGYLLGRALHALLGMITVWLTVLLGEKMFPAPVGLLAGLLVACAPLHIRQSSIINEDVILAVTVMLAAHATLSALEKPSGRHFLLAGGSFGLALASKFNGGVFSLPLAFAASWRGRRDRRQIAWLCLAVASSAIVFLALNPYLPFRLQLYREDFGQTARLYSERGAAGGKWHVVESLVQTMAHPVLLGPVLAYLGLTALLVGAVLLVRRASPGREHWFVLTSFPLVYLVALAGPAVYVTGHQWLPLLPFWSIAAAQAVCLVVARLPRWPGLRPVLAALVGLAIVGNGLLYVRRSVVEMPADCATKFLVDQLSPGPALAITEVPIAGIRSRVLRGVVAVATVDSLAALPKTRLMAADAIVLPARHWSESLQRDWLPGARTLTCSPGLFASGETLVAAVHHFVAEPPPIAVELKSMRRGLYSGTFSSPAGGLVSFLVTLPRGSKPIPELRLQGTVVALTWQSGRFGLDQYISERRAVGIGDQQVTLNASSRRRRDGRSNGPPPRLTLLRWEAPSFSPAQPSSP